MRLGQAQLPRAAGVLDRGQGRGAGAAVVAGDGDQVGVGLGHAGGDGADARLGDQLDRDQRLRVDLLEVEDQLRQVLDRVDVVVRRRRDQGHAGHRVAQAGDQAVDLAAGQLAALAGLGALGDLDLQHFGVDQVLRGDAEAAGGHLLDLRAFQGAVARRVLAALARVGARAQAVHRLGQRLVGLRRQRAEGDAGGVEALEDGAQRLDFLQRQRLLGDLDLEQVADHRHRTLVDQRAVVAEARVVALLHGLLQQAHHVRVVGVVFAAVDELEQTALLDRLAGVPGFAGQQLLLGLQIGEARALDAAGDATEAQPDHLVGQADGLEQLGAAVGGDGGDAHLRQDLQQALGDALAVVLERLVQVAEHLAAADQVGQHLVGEERIDRGGAEADQHGEVVRIARGGGLDQDVAVAAQTLLGQAVVHGADRQRGVGRQLAGGDVAVGQHQQHLAGAHRGLGLVGDGAHRGLEADGFLVVEVDDLALEARAVEGHQSVPLGRRDHRGVEDRAVGVVGGLLEDVALGAQAGFQGHHHRFAQRVDRRVGDLGELLAEVVEGRAHALAEHRHGGVVAHRADCFLALLGERTQHLITLLEGDLEHLHVLLELLGVVGRGAVLLVHVGLDAQGVLAQPLAVRVTRLEAVVDVGGVQHLAGLGVHGEDLPRTDAALGQHVFRRVVPHADFRGQGDVAVLGGDPACRAQTVAVEQAHRVATVGEHHAGRAVPRFHVHGVVFVEAAQLDVHGLDVLPGRRNDHAQAAEQVHAAGNQQFEHVIHARGVGTGAVDQRGDAFQVGQQFVGELVAPRHRPVAVAGDGIDLAVMRQKAERLGQRPARQGVGGEALVEHADGGFQTRIAEVRIEAGEIRRHHQALVDDVLGRQAADVEVGVVLERHLGAAAGEEQLDAHLRVVEAFAADEHLLDARQALQRQTAEHRSVHRHAAPADQGQACGGDLGVHRLARAGGTRLVPAEEHHADRVLLGQVHAELLSGQHAQEAVGLLQQQAAAVAGLAVGVDAATVGHAGQGLDGRLQQMVAGLALHVGDQTEAAVVLELLGLVQTCFHRRSHRLTST